MTTVTGVFASSQIARRAADALRQVGIANVNVLLPGSFGGTSSASGQQPGTAAAVSLLVRGVGPVIAIGPAAAALLDPGRAAWGAASERQFAIGLPAGELYVYEDVLRRGKSILFVQARDDEEAQRATMALNAAGAGTIDAAREQHWYGMRDAEREHYEALGGSFDRDECEYRKGFHHAIVDVGGSRPAIREASNYAYRRGYDRGLAWCREQSQK